MITGCGHAGVVSIVRYAGALTGEDSVWPTWIVPGHCTGWRAQHAMGRIFGESFIPNCVGTRLALGISAP